MKLNILLGTLSLATCLVFGTPVVLADPLPPPPLSVVGLISAYSAFYGVSSSTLYKVLNCESQMNPGAIGDNGTSFGIAQIHLPAHPDITKQEALDPNFAIPWTALQFSLGRQKMWSCYTKLV